MAEEANEKISIKKCPRKGTDSAESWFVAVICGILCAMGSSGPRSSGLFYIAIMETFGVSRGEAMWPISLIGGVINLSGIVIGQLNQKLSAKTLLIVGTLLSSSGMMISFFASSISFLTITMGVIYGFGTSMLYIMTTVLVSRWFDKYKGLAMGITYTGSCLSAFIFPHLNYYLYSLFGLKGCLLIYGSILLNGTALAMLVREPWWSTKGKNNRLRYTPNTSVEAERSIDQNNTEMFRKDSLKLAGDAQDKNRNFSNMKTPPKRESNLSVFKNGMFYVLLFGYIAFTFAYDAFQTSIVDFGTDRGATVSQAVSLVLFYSISDMAGRLCLPVLADRGYLSRSALMMIDYFFVALLLVALSFSVNYITLLVVCLLLGIFIGCSIVMFGVLMGDYIGISRLSFSFGIIWTTSGFLYFSKPAFVGYFRDYIGSYDNMFRLCAAFVFMASMLWLGVVLVEKKKRNGGNSKDSEEEPSSNHQDKSYINEGCIEFQEENCESAENNVQCKNCKVCLTRL